MTITINSLTISGSEITIGYDKQSQSDLTGKGYFYRIASLQTYKSAIKTNSDYMIDFWGNTLLTNEVYTKSPYHQYPLNSKTMNKMNLLGSSISYNNTKNTLFCVGGVEGFYPDKILTYLKSSPGKQAIKSYDGIVLDIEKVYLYESNQRTFKNFWSDISTICSMWDDKYKIFCVISAGCATDFGQDYSLFTSDKGNLVKDFIEPMYTYIKKSSNNAYLAPMLYGGPSTTSTYTFVKDSGDGSKSILNAYNSHDMNTSLLPIIVDNSVISTFWNSLENTDNWKWKLNNNYIVWPDSVTDKMKTPLYLSKGCPYDFSRMFCPYKDEKNPVKGTCDKTCGLDKAGNPMYCSNISSYCESPSRPPFECVARTYTFKSGDTCYNIIKSMYPPNVVTDVWPYSVAVNTKLTKNSNAVYCNKALIHTFAVGEKVAVWKNGSKHTSDTSYIHFAKQDTGSLSCNTFKTPSNNVYILTEDETNMTPCSGTYKQDDILLICPKSTPLPPNAGPCDCYKCGDTTSAGFTSGVCSPANTTCGSSISGKGCYTNAPSNCDCGLKAYNKAATPAPAPAPAPVGKKYSCSFETGNPVCVPDPGGWTDKAGCEEICK